MQELSKTRLSVSKKVNKLEQIKEGLDEKQLEQKAKIMKEIGLLDK